jgi:hypothetical protein
MATLGARPYDGYNNIQVATKVSARQLTLAMPPDASARYALLVPLFVRCMQPDVTNRPECHELYGSVKEILNKLDS